MKGPVQVAALLTLFAIKGTTLFSAVAAQVPTLYMVAIRPHTLGVRRYSTTEHIHDCGQ